MGRWYTRFICFYLREKIWFGNLLLWHYSFSWSLRIIRSCKNKINFWNVWTTPFNVTKAVPIICSFEILYVLVVNSDEYIVNFHQNNCGEVVDQILKIDYNSETSVVKRILESSGCYKCRWKSLETTEVICIQETWSTFNCFEISSDSWSYYWFFKNQWFQSWRKKDKR